MPCDPNALLEQAKCINACVPQGMMQAAGLALLCNIANGGGGGGGGPTFPAGATHYWKLDEASGTRNDSVGTTHLAETTAVGAAAGKKNNGANFVWNTTNFGDLDGTVDILIASAFSIVGWFKFSSVATNQAITVEGTTAGGFPVGITILCGSDLLNFRLSEEDNISVNFTPDTSFHLFCLTASGTTAKIYLDGTEVASDAGKTIDFDDWNTFQINAGNSGSTAGTVGIVDEVAVFDRVLTPTEVSDIWNGGTGAFGP